MNKSQRFLTKAHLMVSIVPWTVLAYFTLYAFLMRRALGHWPVLFENTPAGFLEYFSRVGDYALLGLVLSVPVWIVLLGLRFAVRAARWQIVWRFALVFALGWCAFVGVLVVDPVHFVDWFLD